MGWVYLYVMEIKNRVIVVTGASAGIGEATARLLFQKGARLVLAARSVDKLRKIADTLPGSLVIPADVTDHRAIKKLITTAEKHFGRIDILINNAGIGYDASVEKTDPEKLRQVFEVNVLAPLVAMQTVIPIMRRQGSGLIINVSSGTSLMYLPYMSGYSGLKRTLNAISLTAAKELEKDHIKVSVIYPYMTATDFAKNTLTEHERIWDPAASGRSIRPPDPPELVAAKIAELVNSEAPEMSVHDWM